MPLSRRHFITTAVASAALPRAARANTATEIMWEDLIPPGVPYSEIIAEGEMDERNDIWRPIFDGNARKLNPALDDALIKMPGFILPLDVATDGVSEFLLVPYVGACLHVPPPPPNQLVLVTTNTPWPQDDLWQPIWVTGTMRHDVQTTDLAEVGYTLTADEIEVYIWD